MAQGLKGLGAWLVGGELLKGVGKLVEHGNDLVKIQRDMKQATGSTLDVQNAYNKAWEQTAKFQNMSAVEIMKMQNDARMTFGSQSIATQHIQPFVQMASFLKAYEGHEKGSRDSNSLMREINAAMKSGELAGKITPDAMAEHVKQLTAMKIAYGEQVKITQYLAAQRTCGVALRNTSDAFRYGMFPALIQEQGASAGVMLMTAFNKIVAGVGNRTLSLQRMDDLGLLHKDQIKYDKVGRAIGLKDPSAIMNNREAAINFGDWVMTTLKPLLDKKTGGHDPIRESQLISGMFPDRNAAKAITEVLQQFTKLTKDANMMAATRKAMNMGEYTDKSYDYQIEAFKTQWTNLMDALGAPIVGAATEVLKSINETMAPFAQWIAHTDPANVKAIGALFIALGVGVTALGVGLIGSAILGAIGVGGWLIAGVFALGAAAHQDS